MDDMKEYLIQEGDYFFKMSDIMNHRYIKYQRLNGENIFVEELTEEEYNETENKIFEKYYDYDKILKTYVSDDIRDGLRDFSYKYSLDYPVENKKEPF